MTSLAVLIAFFSGLSAGATTYSDFQLNAQGDQICKVIQGQAQKCYAAISSEQKAEKTVDLIARFKTFAQVKQADPDKWNIDDLDRVGGAFLIEKTVQEQIMDEFSALSVRDLGVEPGATKDKDGNTTQFAFIAAVDWADKKQNSGTINVEGIFDLQSDSKADGNTDREKLSRLFYFDNFSDSSPQARQARFVHFTSNSTSIKTQAQVDEQTLDLLKSEVAPFVLGDVFIVPMAKQIAVGLGEAIKQLFEGLGKALNPQQQ